MTQTGEGKSGGSGSRANARERARSQAEAARRRSRLTQILVIGVVALVVVGIIGAAVIISVVTQGRQTPSADTTVPVGAGVRVPFAVDGSAIRIGPKDAKVQIELYASYGCQHCKEYDAATAPAFEQLIAEGDVAVSYRMIKIPTESAYATLGGNAGAAVAAHQPEQWLAFHTALFAQQSAETEAWQAPEMRAFATSRGIGTPEALAAIDEGRYSGWITENTKEAVQAGFRQTPTLVINGQTTEALPAAQLIDRVHQLAGR